MAGASSALKGFAHASSCGRSSGKAAFLPAYLVPAVLPECTFSKRAHGLKYQTSRRHASVTHSTHDRGDGYVYRMRGLPIEVYTLRSSPRRLRPGPWAAAIESYLPPNLRLGAAKAAEGATQHEPLRPIHTLPDVLSMARSSCKEDVLSYIAVYQERWDAVIWLVKAMTEGYPGHRETEKTLCQLPPSLWETVDQPLDEFTDNPIELEMPQPSAMSWERYSGDNFDKLRWHYDPNNFDAPHILGRKSLGQIWQSLGAMILQAADRPSEDSSYSVIMSKVFQLLGYLHRIDALPDSTYNYDFPTDPTVLRRPPTLHVLSKRIMSTLSDVEWELEWDETTTKALSQGYDLPKASVQPKTREFGPELWLDLVLWACVEGGWVSEGAWIVIQMQKRSTSKDTRWSTISWPEICQRKAPKLGWTSILRSVVDRTSLNQVGGIGIASGTNLDIKLGARTVSREAVLALVDGLLNGPQYTSGGVGMTTVELRRSIVACKGLLDYNHSELDGKFMDAVILRIHETFEMVREQPGLLSRFLDLRPTELKQGNRQSHTASPAQDHEIDDPAAVLGLHYGNLYRFSSDGNLDGSLRTFRKIQNIVDTQREGEMITFAKGLRERLGRGEDVSDLIEEEKDRVALPTPPPFPLSALISFIHLITDSRLFDLGNWLLLNEDIDGGLVEPALYSEQSLQPALLRFGIATSNSRLLKKILLGLEMPLPEAIVHSLLRFQVALGKWTAVEELLNHLKNAPDMGWKANDATSIAKAVLQMEHKWRDNPNPDSIIQALSILQNLISGRYNSEADPSQLSRDFTQRRMANQLGRILQTLPGSLRKITIRPPEEDSLEDLRAYASIDIGPNAFNIILEPMVDIYGSLAGKKLWDLWCREPNTTWKREQYSDPSFGARERVVDPKLYMLRNVLRPVLETRRALRAAMRDELKRTEKAKTATSTNGSGQSPVRINNKKFRLGVEDERILDWGIDMFKAFGLSEGEINTEIPGSFPQRQRTKHVDDEDDDDDVDT